MRTDPQRDRGPALPWLTAYYFVRAGVAAAWVAAALGLGRGMPAVAATLLVAYPAWDALANLADARRNGGLAGSPSQALNAAISAATALAVAVALGRGPNAVLAVFGAWAILSGLLQLLTGARRWRAGAQWAMVLSGAQSALAGGFFVRQAAGAAVPGIVDVAPYAAFGAFYFLVSAAWLTAGRVAGARRLGGGATGRIRPRS
ncbi:hypothetical protein MRF4_00050 [Methylobacterium radiotolerans]|uniref:DUF308 domain-containing protein n=1 Tax=Methylobacterium oryzae TaxID=334852 RepID=A0ABU7TNF4_9HYPH